MRVNILKHRLKGLRDYMEQKQSVESLHLCKSVIQTTNLQKVNIDG